MISREQVLTNPRLAGATLRYHTWSTLQRQTIAEHSFNCLLIWYELYGWPTPQVTAYFLWHDLGELVLGDLPFPVKARNPALKAVCDAVEKDAVKAMGGPELELPELLKVRCKCVDLLDMLYFGVMELALGNKFGAPIVEDITKALEDLTPKLPLEDKTDIAAYVKGIHALLER